MCLTGFAKRSMQRSICDPRDRQRCGKEHLGTYCGKYKPKKVDEVLNRNVSESLTRKGVFSEAIDDLTGTKCTIFYQIRFEDWKEMEAVYGEDLPLVLKGYRSRDWENQIALMLK